MYSIHPRLRLLLLSVVVLFLAACGSTPQKPSPVAGSSAAAAQAGHPAPSMPKAGSGRGGYYKDDGPGDNPPDGLELTLDAEPKVEPYSISGNKPYVVFGKTYTPLLADVPFSQRGIGSWYGKKFHGQKTSSGEPYDMYKMTAAHPTLPIPSYARITNLSNGKQVIVKINDRGPFHSSRIVDLSYTAALKLDYLGRGSSELLLERLLPADIEKMAENRKNNPARALASASAPVSVSESATVIAPAPTVRAVLETVPVAAAPTAVLAPLTATVVAKPDNAALEAMLAGQSATTVQTDLISTTPTVTAAPNPASGFYLQFGAFGLRSNAEATFTHVQTKLAQLPGFEIVQQGTLYRLFSGPFVSRDEALGAVELALNVGLPKPIIVQR